MERRKSLIKALKPTNPKTWHKNTIILILAIFFIFTQVYELEHRTKEIKANLSQHRLDNSPFYQHLPVAEINKANNYLIERENQIVEKSISNYQKRIAIQAIFFMSLLILTNIDLRKKEVRLRLKRYRKELLH